MYTYPPLAKLPTLLVLMTAWVAWADFCASKLLAQSRFMRHEEKRTIENSILTSMNICFDISLILCLYKIERYSWCALKRVFQSDPFSHDIDSTWHPRSLISCYSFLIVPLVFFFSCLKFPTALSRGLTHNLCESQFDFRGFPTWVLPIGFQPLSRLLTILLLLLLLSGRADLFSKFKLMLVFEIVCNTLPNQLLISFCAVLQLCSRSRLDLR